MEYAIARQELFCLYLSGDIVTAEINGLTKSTTGSAGSLRGYSLMIMLSEQFLQIQREEFLVRRKKHQ